MSRIRSIHPGQWTDEDFVECGFAARLLAIGLRNEADDNGVFDWKPTRLKMRLFPADPVDVGELLEELTARGIVMRFEAEGRSYGVIRNFRIFQNPRSPKAEYPITPEADAFAGDRVGEGVVEKKAPGRPRKSHDAETDEAEPKSFPQSVENNSVRRGEERRVVISPSDSSIGEPTDLPALPVPADDPTASADDPPVSQLLAVDDVGPAFAEYQTCRSEFVPGAKPLRLDPDRRRKLAARLSDVGGLPGWAEVLARIRGSPFLRGETSRNGFVAEIEWLLKPENLRKVMEGNYDDNRSGARRPRPVAGTSPLAAMRTARDRLGLGGP